MWMLTNAALAIIVENISGLETNAEKLQVELRARQNAYFTFILWATFGLSAVRFLGVRPCVTILRRRRIQCSHGYRVVLVVLLQAQPLQVLPQELKDCALRANTSRGAFTVVSGLPGVLRGHTIIDLRHISYSPPGNENTPPNLTFHCDGRFRFLPDNTADLRSRYLAFLPHFYCCCCRRRPCADTLMYVRLGHSSTIWMPYCVSYSVFIIIRVMVRYTGRKKMRAIGLVTPRRFGLRNQGSRGSPNQS